MTDDNQQGELMLHDRITLVDPVADTLVVGDRDAAMRAAVFQPLLIRAIGWKQIMVPFDLKAGCGQDGRELLPEITVGEINAGQAARSYRTASSISSGRRS